MYNKAQTFWGYLYMKNISKIVVSAVAVTGILGTVLGVHFGYAKKTDDFEIIRLKQTVSL